MADGRVLAEDVVAPMDQPPFDRSAMDGYAVRAADVAGATRGVPKVLRLIGRAYTAEPFAGTLAPGDCVEIATGAPIPDGADAVVMVEDTGRPGTADWPAPAWLDSGEQVLVLAEAQPGQHAIRRGSDMRADDVVAARRTGDHAEPDRRAGGDRTRSGARRRQADRRDLPDRQRGGAAGAAAAAGLGLRRQLVHGGGAGRAARRRRRSGTRRCRDTIEAVATALDAAAGADIVVLGGGSSVGERDVVIDAVAARGEVIFHGIAVKPGKPTLFARIGRRSASVFGMPGNPTSCLSQAHVLLMPALRQLAGLPPIDPPRVRRRLASAVGSPAQPAPVPAGADRGRPGGADVQGIRGDHQPVAGGRLRGNPGGGSPPRRRDRRRGGGLRIAPEASPGVNSGSCSRSYSRWSSPSLRKRGRNYRRSLTFAQLTTFQNAAM